MRIPSVCLAGAIAAVAIAVLAGCSGSTSSGAPSLMPGNTAQTQSHVRSLHKPLDAMGIPKRFYNMLRHGPIPRPTHTALVLKYLAVSDFGTGAVEILDRHFNLINTITTGLNGPDGDYYDVAQNLYVANYAGINVQEYAPGSSTPTYTYSFGLSDPINVTADLQLNVYVADYGFGGASVVVEYPQGSNTPSATCSTGLANEGIAVDDAGDVFVSGNNPNTGSANILEYVGGLINSGCTPTTLGVTLGFAGGMQIDKHGVLAAIDQYAGVDVIPPPYTSISSTINNGFSDPFHDALNKSQNVIYVADVGNANVQVLTWPGGSPIATIDGSSGLVDPAGVATQRIRRK